MKMPSTDELAHRLSGLLGRSVSVVDRVPLGTGTFPKELVRVRSESVDEPVLFVKFEGGVDHDNAGHRGGVSYEARVYEEVLEPAGLAEGLFIGALRSHEVRDTWLVLRFLEDGERVKKVPGPGAMQAAARWIGRLHQSFEKPIAGSAPPWMIRYDETYLRLWQERAVETLDDAARTEPTISRLCDAFRNEGIPSLVSSFTLIHGEYYPKNVLWSEGRIVPVDWESAAIGAGEIDLAMLIDGWPEDVSNACMADYSGARWPTGPVTEFPKRYFWARVYTALRWLADSPPGTMLESAHLVGLRKLAAET
jgi:hypothetical protein